jgi:hypothetical protein
VRSRFGKAAATGTAVPRAPTSNRNQPRAYSAIVRASDAADYASLIRPTRFALAGAVCNAGAVIQTRCLTESETTSSIVFYFSLICALAGLATWPLGKLVPSWEIEWLVPDRMHLVALMRPGCAAASRTTRRSPEEGDGHRSARSCWRSDPRGRRP